MIVSFLSLPLNLFSQNENGLTGSYFSNMTLTDPPCGTRIDTVINFDWGTGPNFANCGQLQNHYSVRWTGLVIPLYSEKYSFYTVSDDGERLWVNDSLLVDAWTDHGADTYSGKINLISGQSYDIKMEYYQNSAGASAKLYWQSPSQPKEIIPSSQLRTSMINSVNEFSLQNKIQIFPNPFSNETTITFPNNINDNYTLIIYDLQGTQVKKFSEINMNKIIISSNNLNDGLYLFTLNNINKGNIYQGKFIIIK